MGIRQIDTRSFIESKLPVAVDVREQPSKSLERAKSALSEGGATITMQEYRYLKTLTKEWRHQGLTSRLSVENIAGEEEAMKNIDALPIPKRRLTAMESATVALGMASDGTFEFVAAGIFAVVGLVLIIRDCR